MTRADNMATFILRRSLAARPNIASRSTAVNMSFRHTSTSALYSVSALSDRHETQHFHKLSRLPLMEHSPTLKLIHTSEVAPGASSALSSSLLVNKRSEQQENGAQVQTKQEEITAGEVEGKSTEVSKKLWDDQAVSTGRAILSNYRKEIKGLSKQLYKQKAKAVELEQIAENRPEELQRVVNMRNGHSFALHGVHPRTGRPLTRKEYDELASGKTGGILLSLIFIVTAFFVGLRAGRTDAAAPSRITSGGSNIQPKSKADVIGGGSDHMGSGAQSGVLDNSWGSLLWKKQ